MNFTSTLIEKIWDTVVDKGISALLRPWQMKRENKARLECLKNEKLETIKIEHEAKQLQISLDKDQFTNAEIVPQIEQIASDVVNTKLHDIIREEVSVMKAVEYAAEYVETKNLKDEKPSEKPTDDWLNKWKKKTQEFTDEDALKLWGRVLAGEFTSPGRYSYKFLDWMSNITPKDALLISKLMENVISDFYYRGENMDKNMPLTYDDLLILQELDVLQGVESMGLNITYKSYRTDFFQKVLLSSNNKKMLLIKDSNMSRELKINGVCSLTRIGKEVRQLCEVNTNCDMIQKVGEHIIKQGFDVYWADVISIEKGNISHSPLVKINIAGVENASNIAHNNHEEILL